MKNWIAGGLMLLAAGTFAQEAETEVVVLTLDDCIRTAMERNTTLKRAKNEEISAQYRRMQAIGNYFPNVSAGVNYDFFFGNFFDTNAARQVSATTSSSNPNISANMVLFNGFSNHYLNAQRKNELLAANEGVKGAEQNIEGTILTNYLTVILDLENIAIERERVDLLQIQLDREKKRLSVGVGDLESVYNIQSQLANQKLTLNNLENTYKRDHLTLIQSMQLDVAEKEYTISGYEISDEELLVSLPPFDEMLESILSQNPTIVAAKYNMNAAKYQTKVARSAALPSITAFGRVGTNYSSNGALNPTTGEYEPNATAADQFQYNEFEYVNFSLNIPIFSKFQTSNSIQQAKVNMANSELGLYESINNITNLVQQAYLDLANAQNSYISAKENLEAAQQSFEFMKKRYETGNTDFYTYAQSLNNKNRAQVVAVNAKYTIVFRRKILELYRSE